MSKSDNFGTIKGYLRRYGYKIKDDFEDALENGNVKEVNEFLEQIKITLEDLKNNDNNSDDVAV